MIPRSSINFSSFRWPRLGLYFFFFFHCKFASKLFITHPAEHWCTSFSSTFIILGMLGPHKSTSKIPTWKIIKAKKALWIEPGINKLGIFSPCPFGKQLSHLACLGPLLACLGKWFTSNKVTCPATISSYPRWLNGSFFFQALCVDWVTCTADRWASKWSD